MRGEGRLGCAGAVSITIRTEGYKKFALVAGPIYTNSSQPLEALVFTPTPTAPPATPTRGDAVPAKSMPASTVTIPTTVPTVGLAEAPGAEESATPSELVSSEARVQAPGLDRVVVAPLGKPSPQPEREPEEAVYGEIVNE